MVPSFFLVLWIYLLLGSHPWDGAPDVTFLSSITPLGFAGLGVALVLISIAVAVITHPLQFLAVQMLEGYWGPGSIARAWQERRISSHLARRRSLEVAKASSGEAIEDLSVDLAHLANGEVDWATIVDARAQGPLLSAQVSFSSADAALQQYPPLHAAVMPTRLGNVLRRYESLAGSAISLPLIDWANHIGMVAKASDTNYVQDQRNGMDLAVRMTVTCLAMFVTSFALLWPHGFWLLVALVPLIGAWLSYRGAIVAADSYGRALTAWLHLNRFRLYEALNLSPITDADQERTQNKALAALVEGKPEFRSRYMPSLSQRPLAGPPRGRPSRRS